MISFTNPSITNGDISLLPKGTGTVNVNNTRIKNVADPVNLADAVNMQTLQSTVQSKALVFSMDTTGLTDAQIASTVLTVIAPELEYAEGTLCRIHCVNSGVRTNKQFKITAGTWQFDATL